MPATSGARPTGGDHDYDVIIVGSGFGGSVSALRLAEKGYRVAVLEAGARFEDEDFAKTSFDVKRFLFRPEIGCYGIQRIDAVRDSLILAGAGVGGGSLVYANTLYEPLDAFYRDAQWRDITDWKSELAPYYDQAKRMLGVVENPLRTPSDEVMQQVAGDMGVGDTFHPTPVGVFFGGPDSLPGEKVADPFFGGAGPERHTLHRLRRLHDRVQVQRQEHAGEELPVPRGAAGRSGAAAVDRDAGAAPRRRRVRRHAEVHQGPAGHLAHRRARSPPSTSSSLPLPSAPRSCCTG